MRTDHIKEVKSNGKVVAEQVAFTLWEASDWAEHQDEILGLATAMSRVRATNDARTSGSSYSKKGMQKLVLNYGIGLSDAEIAGKSLSLDKAGLEAYCTEHGLFGIDEG